MIGNHKDITERKQAEEALRESERRLKLAQQSSGAGVWDWDIGSDRLDWSRELFVLFGLDPDKTEATFDIWDQVLHPDDKETAYSRIEKSIKQGTSLDSEYRIVLPDGQVRWIRALGSAIYDQAKQPIRMAGICIDITEQKRTVEALRESEQKYRRLTFLPDTLIVTFNDITDRKRIEEEQKRLEAQNRQLHKAESLGRMAGAIAHNFNNQLQVVIGNLEMAMDDLPLGSEPLEEALKAAHKAADISGLMLTFSGKQPGEYEPIDLSAACRQSLTLLQAAAPKCTILKADLPASGPVIRCNAGQIQQVIINLITNAWESADENRRGIGLTVKPVSLKDIAAFKHYPVDWNPQESVYACLEVADAGSGISGKDIEKIFDPFYTSKFTGRGMGLSVVLGIVRSHNGGITVESEPGRGSTFRVFFPLSVEKVHRQPDKQIQSPEIKVGGTVLLIEDEEQVRNMANKMLTHLGYTVIEAKDGSEAVQIFQQHQDNIRFVLSDLTMPRMNGWDTLAALRKISPEIPVILSSGYDEAQVMAGEHTEQPNAFLGKPYQLKGLKETLNRVLADKNIIHLV